MKIFVGLFGVWDNGKPWKIAFEINWPLAANPTQHYLFHFCTDFEKSGLIEIQKILKNIKGITFSQFKSEDVVRHPLVKKIVNAYEKYQEQDSWAYVWTITLQYKIPFIKKKSCPKKIAVIGFQYSKKIASP